MKGFSELYVWVVWACILLGAFILATISMNHSRQARRNEILEAQRKKKFYEDAKAKGFRTDIDNVE